MLNDSKTFQEQMGLPLRTVLLVEGYIFYLEDGQAFPPANTVYAGRLVSTA